jgi:hypothetical protein
MKQLEISGDARKRLVRLQKAYPSWILTVYEHKRAWDGYDDEYDTEDEDY